MEIKNKNYAFTLIELLVVIVILGILGVVGTDLFSSVLKGTNKANVITEVKQNGQLAMDVIERNIRDSTAASNLVILPNPPDTSVLILDQPDGEVTIRLVKNSGENGKITLKKGATGSEEAITSIDTKTGVDVESATFTINEPPTSNPSAPQTVVITLNLRQGISASTRNDFTADVSLTTTVSLRTY